MPPDTVPEKGEVEKLVADLRKAMSGVTPGPWAAHMDDYTLRVAATYIPEQEKIALCATGAKYVGHNVAYLALCSPDNISKLLDALAALSSQLEDVKRERDEILDGDGQDIRLLITQKVNAQAERDALAERLAEAERVIEHERSGLKAYIAESCQGDNPIKEHARIVAEARLSEVEVIARRAFK